MPINPSIFKMSYVILELNVEINMLLNCYITKADIICTEDILGPNLGFLKGIQHIKPCQV